MLSCFSHNHHLYLDFDDEHDSIILTMVTLDIYVCQVCVCVCSPFGSGDGTINAWCAFCLYIKTSAHPITIFFSSIMKVGRMAGCERPNEERAKK